MPRSFRTDVGHIWDLVVRKWSGTHAKKTNCEWNKIAEVMMLNFGDSGKPVFQAINAAERRIFEKRAKMVKRLFTTTEMKKRLNWFFARLHLWISSISTEQSKIGVKNYSFLVIPTEITNADDISQSSTLSAQGNLLQKFGNSQNFWWSEIVGALQRCWFLIEDTLILKSSQHPDREGGFVFEYENRTRLGCKTLSSRKTLLYGGVSWSNLVQRPNNFMDSFSEWYQQIRHRIARKIPLRTFNCSLCEFQLCTCPWKDTDRHWQLFCSVKIHDQNTATWPVNSSRMMER